MRKNLLSLIVVVCVAALSGCNALIVPAPVAAATTASAPPPTATTTTTSTPTVPAAPAASEFGSVTNFGDSITCGFYAMPNNGSGYLWSTEGYATLLDQQLGAAAKNLCRSGDMAADMARLWVYPNAEPALAQSQLYTVLIGTNDAHVCGASAGCVANWSQSLAASLAWLALPAADKLPGTGMTVTGGSWSADIGSAMATKQNGASLSFTVQQAVEGRQLYVAYRAMSAQGGSALLSVDGVALTTLNATGNAGQTVTTQNGTPDTIFLQAVPLGAEGTHTVTLTMTSPDGTFFSVVWAGASSQSYASVPGAPRVVIGSITTTTYDPLNQTVAVYNAALTPLVAGLVADGMNITLAPTGSALDASTDMADLLHPNNAGHARLAAAFASVLPQQTAP